jgi:hypothetical protein
LGGANSTGIGASNCQLITLAQTTFSVIGGLTRFGSSIALLTISDTSLTAIDRQSVACVLTLSGAVRLQSASLNAYTEGGRLFSVSPENAGLHDLLCLYGSASTKSERLGGVEVNLLQIGNLKLPNPHEWKVSVNV